MTSHVLTENQRTAWARYQRMRVRLSGRLNRELATSTGLSEADYEILVALAERPNESARALALRCGLDWEKSRLSHQLRRMEARGLVVRESCREDNRGSVIRLTEKGRVLSAEALAAYEQAVRRHVVEVLTPEQLETLGEIADVLLAPLAEGHKA